MVIDKKAEMGIGTLVLFIAMILVAAIAAGVLIQTATTLQSRALETGKRSTTEVSTGIKTILLYGENASVNRSIQYLRHHIKLVAGSDPIKFDDTVISLDLNDQLRDYLYNSNHSCYGARNDEFRIRYIKNGTGHIDGYLVTGDVIEICYEAPREIFEDELIRINIIPKVGSVLTLRVMSPSVMITRRVFLYP
ncbi:hypothetical protein JXM83_00560 [Candidatus Woesearchaeota archaeon]|nr:hypothetical protein [Candidatus Woesearchaeota archaeon]